jgi:phosphate-selective porin
MGSRINNQWEVTGRFDWSANYYKEVYMNPLWQYIFTRDITRKYLLGVNYYPIDHIKLQLDYERDYTHKANSAWLNCQYAINFE